MKESKHKPDQTVLQMTKSDMCALDVEDLQLSMEQKSVCDVKTQSPYPRPLCSGCAISVYQNSMLCLSYAIYLIPHCTEGYESPKESNVPVSLHFLVLRYLQRKLPPSCSSIHHL